MQLIEIDQLKN